MSNNSILLSSCIDQFKKSNELSRSDSEIFELFCITQVTKGFDVTFEDINKSIVDGSQDGGIDSLMVLIDDVYQESIDDLDQIQFSHKTQLTFVIGQCKKENSFKESALDKLIASLPELFSLEKSEDALLVRFNPDLVAHALVAREAWKRSATSGGKLKVVITYCCIADRVEINSPFQSKIEQLKSIANSIFSAATIQHSNYSSTELLKLYSTHRNQRLSLEFKEVPLATTYDTYGIGYVGTVLLGQYKKFLSDEDGSVRDDLFESNIRHFQGNVDVNRKIKQTVEQRDKNDFWWLNNGITIIAQNPNLYGRTLSLDNVQIVNGLQTSYSIYNNHSGAADDHRSVLVKVIVNEDKETIDNIIASTNSQNPVSPALLRATDTIQRNIEMYFGDKGYFYDRRKNYYKNQQKPVAKIFSIQTVAQAIESILFDDPFSARARPTSLIKDDGTYHKIFNPSTNFHIYLQCCLLVKAVNDNWGTIPDENIKAKVVNFKLHLSRVLASVLLGRPRFRKDELAAIHIDHLDAEKFRMAVTILTDAIDEYQKAHADSNLISMSKTKPFTDFLLGRLEPYLRQTSI